MGVLRSVRGAAWGYTRVQRRAAAVPGMSAVGIIFICQNCFIYTLEDLTFSCCTWSFLSQIVNTKYHIL